MNNDRFKFRVWDKDRGEYLGEDWGVLAENGKLLDVYAVSTEHPHIQCDWAKDQSRYTIEQCTGLRDKNGDLIYEGDMVVLGGNPPLRVMWHYCEWSLFGDGYACRCNSWEESEIVGNIHEVNE